METILKHWDGVYATRSVIIGGLGSNRELIFVGHVDVAYFIGLLLQGRVKALWGQGDCFKCGLFLFFWILIKDYLN